MGRYLEAQCRLCRREGMKLFLKGPKCRTEKCPFTKRPYPPGSNVGRRQRKQSYYAMQLREKQKVKRMYGILEKQFRRFFSIAAKSKGATGRKLIELLELRLDNVVFRALFSLSRNEARQVVRHGFVRVNDRRVDIPSFLVKEGDVIIVTAKEKLAKKLKENILINSKERSVPKWMSVDNDQLKITLTRLPEKEDLILPVNEQYIVELYSK